MGKKEITAGMAKEAGITLHQAQKAFLALVEGLRTALRAGTKVNLAGFGSFEVKVRQARRGRNPKTGEAIEIQAKKRVKFNPSRSFKNTL
ncbi:MAG: HU family DNA-binding protein [Candidatus Aminicenantes bacterium]|nr:HU family DNA-binding protein [Candidatus Aminicenantes bacterium]